MPQTRIRGGGSGTRSFNGCWTCRLRRKKCDERKPVCKQCAGLRVPCHSSAAKPAWMDGGIQQEEMAQRLKRQVRSQALRRTRYGDSPGSYSGDDSVATLPGKLASPRDNAKDKL